MKCHTSAIVAAAAAGLFSATPTFAAVWDGNGDANASGNWSTANNWNPDGVPSAVPADLNDVTTGTRTVTLDSVIPSVATFSITQSTAGAVNGVSLTTPGADILISDVSGFTMTNSTGQIGAINLAMSGGDIRLTNTGSSTVTLNSTVGMSNGSRFVTSNSGIGSTYSIDGALTMVGGGTNSNPGLYVGNGAGIFDLGATGSIDVSGGLSVFGRATSGSTNRGQTVNNSGTVTVQNGGTLRINSAQNFETSDFNNNGTTTLGNSVTAGEAVLDMQTTTGSSGGVGRFDNTSTGVLNVYGSSFIDLGDRSDSSANAVFTNASGGQVTFAGDGVGAGIRSTFSANDQVYATVTNSGTLTVTNHASVAEGKGIINHAGRAARMDVTNAATGVWTVQQTADLEISTTNSGGGPKTLTVSNAGTFTIGNGAANTTGGSIVSIAARGTSDTASAATITVGNTGSLALQGDSTLEVASDSVMTTWSFANTTGGTIELNNISTIGNTGTVLTFTNAATLNKTGVGTASILSNAGGSFANNGTLDLDGGVLVISSDVTTGSNAIYSFSVGGASIASLSLGGDLNLTGDNVQLAIFGVLSAPSYTIATFAGGLTGTFDDVSAATSQGYSVVYGTNSIQLVVPEPAMLSLVALGGLCLGGRRRSV